MLGLIVTFIVLARRPSPSSPRAKAPADLTDGMIGDVNVFLSRLDEGEGDDKTSPLQGELEVMIAESSQRRKGCATQALQLLISYVCGPPLSLSPLNLLARVGMGNGSSTKMFEKLGFEVVKEVVVFQELEMRLRSKGALEVMADNVSQITKAVTDANDSNDAP